MKLQPIMYNNYFRYLFINNYLIVKVSNSNKVSKFCLIRYVEKSNYLPTDERRLQNTILFFGIIEDNIYLPKFTNYFWVCMSVDFGIYLKAFNKSNRRTTRKDKKTCSNKYRLLSTISNCIAKVHPPRAISVLKIIDNKQ